MKKNELIELIELASDIGIEAVSFRKSNEHKIVIDWNGETEQYATLEQAKASLRQAAL